MTDETLQTATLGGGCFWCLEAAFVELDGVQAVRSGYAGGDTDQPTYREVCGGHTGHAEVVQVRYDPAKLSFRELLEVFFTIHDPTTPNRQGADVGTQYRSIILYENEQQLREAQTLIRELDSARIWDNPIVTELRPLEVFYPAESYHQDYYAQNSSQPYCQVVIAPKLAKLRQKHADKLRG